MSPTRESLPHNRNPGHSFATIAAGRASRAARCGREPEDGVAHLVGQATSPHPAHTRARHVFHPHTRHDGRITARIADAHIADFVTTDHRRMGNKKRDTGPHMRCPTVGSIRHTRTPRHLWTAFHRLAGGLGWRSTREQPNGNASWMRTHDNSCRCALFCSSSPSSRAWR